MPSITFVYNPSMSNEVTIQQFFKGIIPEITSEQALNVATLIGKLLYEHSISLAFLLNLLWGTWEYAQFKEFNYLSIESCITAIEEYLNQFNVSSISDISPEEVAQKAILGCF